MKLDKWAEFYKHNKEHEFTKKCFNSIKEKFIAFSNFFGPEAMTDFMKNYEEIEDFLIVDNESIDFLS